MKVLFVYKYLTLGGVESVLSARLRGLEAEGIDARAWFLMDGGGRSLFQGQEERLEVGGPEELSRFLAEESVDLVASVDTPEVFPLLAENDGPTLVVETHTTYGANLGYLRSVREVRPAAIFVPSATQAGLVRSRAGDEVPIRVVPNPLAEDFTRPLAEPPARRRPAIGWVGRLDAHKNWRQLLEVAARVGDPPAEIWLVGKAAEPGGGETLYRRAEALGVVDRLRWWPGLPRPVLVRLLDELRAAGGVMLVTSKAESFGMTVAEGMARGCAVVVPDRGPFDEFVEDGVSGRLYRPGDVSAAAARVAELLGDSASRSRLGERARETVLGRFAAQVSNAVLARELRRLS